LHGKKRGREREGDGHIGRASVIAQQPAPDARYSCGGHRVLPPLVFHGIGKSEKPKGAARGGGSRRRESEVTILWTPSKTPAKRRAA